MSALHVAIFLAAAALSGSSVVKPAPEDTFELLILHNNDMHARFEQTSQQSGTCTTEDREKGKCYGGFPRVAHVVKEARKAAASGQGPPVLYLNAGDTYTGTAWFTIYKWKIAAEFINALQPDAVSLGNNELEKGNKISPFLTNIKTNILASNVRVNSDVITEKLQKSLIIDISGRKVGVIGYLTPENAALDSVGEIEYIDEVTALKEETTKLKAKNINIIIALGHSSIEKCIEIAKQVEDLDLVISGYKNVFNANGTSAKRVYEKPALVTQNSGKTVPIFQSYSYSEILGKLALNFNANGDLTKFYADSILLDTSIPQDSEALTLSKSVVLNNEVVGQTAVVLDGDSCQTQECNLGNLITDAMMYIYALNYNDERWTDAPIALIPGGAITSTIAPTNRPASVTTSDLQSAIQTTSNIVAVSMSGTVLNEVLEHSIASYDPSKPTGEFLQFSGIRVVYDLDKPPGERVIDAVVRCWDCSVPQYYAIDDWRTYKVLMPSLVANGEYGYEMLVDLVQQDFDRDEVTVTSEFIKLRGLVYPEVAGRIELMNLPDSPDSGMSLSSSPTILILTIISLVIP